LFRFHLLFISIILVLSAAVGFCDTARRYNVLILNSHHPNYSWTMWLMDGITTTIENSGKPIDTDIEYMYSKQFKEPEYVQMLYRTYEHKYADKKFDVIIATDDMAFDFLLKYRDELFPGVPFVFCGIDRPEVLDDAEEGDYTGIFEGKTGVFTVALALRLHPKTRKVILLNDGLLLWFRPWQETLDDLRSNFADRVELIDHSVKNRKLLEVIDEIHTLYDDAPVVLFECFRDAERTYTYNDISEILKERCDAPIYVITRRWLDRGVAVGGNIADGFRQGRIATERAIRILEGESPSDIPIMFTDPAQYMFDYIQLKRFDISISALPEGSSIINEPQSFFYTYKKQILVFAGALAGLIVIISLLLATYLRRLRVEKKLLAFQGQLKSLTSEILLTEDRQRRRIAAELHDRLSQSLIISKLNLDTLRESACSKDITENLDEIRGSLDRIIQNTRALTFDLSSPILYELGFESAVSEWLVENLQQKHGITCTFEEAGTDEILDEDIAVILFRMVRELLINVVEHSGADKVKVSIYKVDGHIYITIEDDGVGFEPSKIASVTGKKGPLGLFAIREKLEHLQGRLDINSVPAVGTKIKITAPLK